METHVALLAIILRDTEVVEQLNELLHQYRNFIIGRMGIPYREKQMQIISIALDAPPDAINALSGKIGRLPGVSSRVTYADEAVSGKLR